MVAPRLMLAAPASGSGKTLLTCGILKALKHRGLKAASFKCGPDYIDPLFHREVLGVPSRNLDTFFTGKETTRYLFCRAAKEADISIIEGVMGYYDGIGGDSVTASSYELAEATDTPVVLIVNAKGMSLSVLAVIQGFLKYREDSRIAGVVLNQISAGVFERLRDRIEQELSIPVFGYVPKCPELIIDSRHLGLVLPEEIEDIQKKLDNLSKLLQTTLDLDGLLALAEAAPEIKCEELAINRDRSFVELGSIKASVQNGKEHKLRIGVAKDEAFCFFYQENLELLTELGAEIVPISLLQDQRLPKELDGLILCGGYPELYAERLSRNTSMRESVRERILGGIPYLAECGGFLYLQKRMEDMDGKLWEMAGVFAGTAYRTSRLVRFGYLTITANGSGQLLQPGEQIAGHEYHYFDCTENGGNYHGRKPLSSRGWDCIQGGKCYAAGFPHLYYYSNPGFVIKFLQMCSAYRAKVRREEA